MGVMCYLVHWRKIWELFFVRYLMMSLVYMVSKYLYTMSRRMISRLNNTIGLQITHRSRHIIATINLNKYKAYVFHDFKLSVIWMWFYHRNESNETFLVQGKLISLQWRQLSKQQRKHLSHHASKLWQLWIMRSFPLKTITKFYWQSFYGGFV